MHEFKRMYLLYSLVLSFVIPIIPLPLDISLPWFGEDMVWLYSGNDLVGSLSAQSGLGTEISNDGDVSALGKKIDYVIIVKLLYLIVTITLLISLCISAIKLLYCVNKRPLLVFPDKKIVLIKEKLVPFSFGQYIYLNEEDYRNGLIAKEMIMHEQAHVGQRHSLDVMFIELLIAIFWINPVLLLYRRAIKQNHEFLADDAVLKAENNITRYQHILIGIISKTGSTGLASSLNYSTIKKRFIMMKRETSQRKARCRKLLLIPALLFAICIFSMHAAVLEFPTNSSEIGDTYYSQAIPGQNEENSVTIVSLENDFYLIHNSRGEYLYVPVWLETDSAYWVAPKEYEDPAKIPSYQWTFKHQNASQKVFSISNREFPSIKFEDVWINGEIVFE